MNIQEIATYMWPCWMMGLFMFFAIYFSQHRSLLRIDLGGLWRWAKILLYVTIFRVVVFKLAGDAAQQQISAIDNIPPLMSLTTFWEDLCFTAPVILLGRFLNDRWYSKLLYYAGMAAMMVSFGSGHIYQGWTASIILALLFVPFCCKIGNRYGLGTIIVGHSAYDLVTILTMTHLLK